jgi:hypothetical protein
MHHVRKVFESLEIVCKANGKKVQGVGNSNYGRRHIKMPAKLKKGNNPSTGKRMQAKDDYGDGGWLHPHHGKEATLMKMKELTVIACGGMKEKKEKMKRLGRKRKK